MVHFTALAMLGLAFIASAQPSHGRDHARRHHSKRQGYSVSTGIATATVSFGSSDGKKAGIVYSPYNGDGSCKTADEVASDVSKLADYSPLRTYGTDCNQVQNVLAAVKNNPGQQMFIGVFNTAEKMETELETIISAMGGEWSYVHTVTVGNEIVNAGIMSAADYANKINSGRSILRNAGYEGPVVGVDTFVAILANPVICGASDYVAANCHPYFDGNVAASDSGKFLNDMKSKMVDACGGKSVLITETGWPHQGETNGAAVPSKPNQESALESIISSQGSNVIFLTAFDDPWKKDSAATFDAEQYWGILSN